MDANADRYIRERPMTGQKSSNEEDSGIIWPSHSTPEVVRRAEQQSPNVRREPISYVSN